MSNANASHLRRALPARGHCSGINVEAAVDAHPLAAKAFNDPGAGDRWRRTMLRTAILLARPEKA